MELLPGIVARLKTITTLKDAVWGIEELEEAIAGGVAKLRTPSAYVILLGEVAGRNPNETSYIDQRLTATFGIVLAVENKLNPRGIVGGGSDSDLQVIRGLVREKILGYAPDGKFDPSEYVRGRLVQVKDGVLWWQEEFTTAYYIRSVQ